MLLFPNMEECFGLALRTVNRMWYSTVESCPLGPSCTADMHAAPHRKRGIIRLCEPTVNRSLWMLVVVQPLVQHVVVALEELNDLTMVDRNRTVPVVIDGLPCLLCGS